MKTNVLVAVIYGIMVWITVARAPYNTDPGGLMLILGVVATIGCAYLSVLLFMIEKSFDDFKTFCVIYACWLAFYASWWTGVYQALYRLVA